MHPLLQKQNEPGNIALLKAASVAYSRAKIFEVVFLRLMFFLAVIVLVIYFYMPTAFAKLLVGCIAFALSISIQLISVFIHSHINKGAMFKEQFDVNVFELKWLQTQANPDELELVQYSNSYIGKEPLNWYSPELKDDLPNEILIAACQRINCAWDVFNRQAFCRFLTGVMTAHSIIFFGAIFFFNPTGLNLLPILFASLSFYLYYINQLRGHWSVIETRKKLSSIIDSHILISKQLPAMDLLRDIQTEILNTRKVPVIVPDFYFRFIRKKMDIAVQLFTRDVNSKW